MMYLIHTHDNFEQHAPFELPLSLSAFHAKPWPQLVCADHPHDLPNRYIQVFATNQAQISDL